MQFLSLQSVHLPVFWLMAMPRKQVRHLPLPLWHVSQLGSGLRGEGGGAAGAGSERLESPPQERSTCLEERTLSDNGAAHRQPKGGGHAAAAALGRRPMVWAQASPTLAAAVLGVDAGALALPVVASPADLGVEVAVGAEVACRSTGAARVVQGVEQMGCAVMRMRGLEQF